MEFQKFLAIISIWFIQHNRCLRVNVFMSLTLKKGTCYVQVNTPVVKCIKKERTYVFTRKANLC
jgi:hypothetical protein